MTRSEIVDLLDRHEDALSRSDSSSVPSLYAEDATVLSPMFGALAGRDEIADSYAEVGEIFANLERTLETRVIEGEKAVAVYAIRATHVGEVFGVPPSHKQTTFTMVFVFEVREGFIAAERRLYDFTSVLMQLGVLRARPA
jgi:steroid delta-isomerase-like uncharacterized protein